MAEDLDQYTDRIARTFANQTIFITGGTGFLGKVLVEKILRCFDAKKIYLLVREKKGKDPKQRLKEVFRNPLFDSVREMKGDEVFEKCVPICGDVSLLGLGITKEDRETLINETEMVFHSAATIRFDESLKKAVLLNVRGTKLMLELALEMKGLKSFVHVSTSYCHLGEKVLYERAYPAVEDPHLVLKNVEWLPEDTVEAMTETLLGIMPNTYAFTKNLGEALCVEMLDKLPLVIARPSVVVPIWKDPLPGWTDNINGPMGLLIGAGKGVLRTMYCNQTTYADFVPVDVVVNGMLCIVREVVEEGRPRRFYNICSSAEYKLPYEDVIELGKKVVYERVPFNGVVWYPGGAMRRSRLMHQICVVLFHYLPAIFIDALLICLGYKPVLWRVQQRITKGFEVFEYYANNQWDFNNDEAMKARAGMNPKERSLYKVDGNGLDYLEYFTTCTHGARLYILHEPDEDLPAARRHMKVMYFVDVLFKGLLYCLAIYLLYKYIFLPILGYVF